MLKPTRQQFAVMAIDALGGTRAVATMFGYDDRVVSNWKQRGLPRHALDGMAPRLTAKGHCVPPDMFGQLAVVEKPVPRPPRRKNGKAPRR